MILFPVPKGMKEKKTQNETTTQKELNTYEKNFILSFKNSKNEINKNVFDGFMKSILSENYNIDNVSLY